MKLGTKLAVTGDDITMFFKVCWLSISAHTLRLVYVLNSI